MSALDPSPCWDQLGTTWCARSRTDHLRVDAWSTRISGVTCVNAWPNVPGVKGSQVQILSSRQSQTAFDRGVSQDQRPFFVVRGSRDRRRVPPHNGLGPTRHARSRL